MRRFVIITVGIVALVIVGLIAAVSLINVDSSHMINLHRPGAGKDGQRLQLEGGIGHGHLAIGVTEQFANLGQAAAGGENGAGS